MLYLYEISSVLQALIFILQTYMRMFSWSELPGMSWFIHLSKQHFPMCPRGLCHFRTSILSYSPFGCCSAPKSCPTLCDTIEYTTPGFPCPSYLPEPTQTHVHHISDAIPPSHPLSSLSPPDFNLSQHQGLFQ